VGYADQPVSREEAARRAAEELAAYAFIRAMMGGDLDSALVLARQHNVSDVSISFVLALVKAATRALMTAEGYDVEAALSSLEQWMNDAADRAAI
jgi:hypothetical protein